MFRHLRADHAPAHRPPPPPASTARSRSPSAARPAAGPTPLPRVDHRTAETSPRTTRTVMRRTNLFRMVAAAAAATPDRHRRGRRPREPGQCRPPRRRGGRPSALRPGGHQPRPGPAHPGERPRRRLRSARSSTATGQLLGERQQRLPAVGAGRPRLVRRASARSC